MEIGAMETIDAQSENTTSGLKPKTHFTGKVVKTSLAGALVDIGEKVGDLVLSICANKSYQKNSINVFKSNLVIRGSSLRLSIG